MTLHSGAYCSSYGESKWISAKSVGTDLALSKVINESSLMRVLRDIQG